MVSERSVSECSDDIDIRPLELSDLKRRHRESSEESLKNAIAIENGQTNRFFSSVMGIKRKKGVTFTSEKSDMVKKAWKNAARKALSMTDPWDKFHLDAYKTETAKRHRFHALKKRWVVDEVLVKMEGESFNRGAMRECFRMKKLSNFDKKQDWAKAHNYVAKRYINEVTNSTYFEDVKLQMDAKLWGEEFNRHNPPKKVDIFQMSVIELTERPGSPLYHVEHFIEGKYVKYNSNSGFVRSEALRMTPQAFSHFTFERSGHELIVVDIQGVGDLYTDPQIHTSSGSDYGDGNLGTRGMALFFHSHICNSICCSLGLTQFDLALSEIDACRKISSAQKSCKTLVRGTEEHVVPTKEGGEHVRLRTLSSGYYSGEERDRYDSIGSVESFDSNDSIEDSLILNVLSENEDSVVDSFRKPTGNHRRIRYDSACDFGDGTETKESDMRNFNEMVQRKSRPSHVYNEVEHLALLQGLQQEEKLTEIAEDDNSSYQSVLGRVHLDLAKYHELNRFVEEDEDYDRDAALFHLNYAAKCSNLDAILAMAQIHMGLPHDILPDIQLEEEHRDSELGFQFLYSAADAGDRFSIVEIAKAFDSGVGLPPSYHVDWREAVVWYDRAVTRDSSDREGNYDGTLDTPPYQLIARQARMYRQGGNCLQKDPNKAGELFTSAADLATEAMKGKLAAKFYMEAEEAWAECEEEDEELETGN